MSGWDAKLSEERRELQKKRRTFPSFNCFWSIGFNFLSTTLTLDIKMWSDSADHEFPKWSELVIAAGQVECGGLQELYK